MLGLAKRGGASWMITTIGFESKPFAYVLWLESGEPRYKTVCYSDKEVREAISLSQLKGHIHYEREYRVVLEHGADDSFFSETSLCLKMAKIAN